MIHCDFVDWHIRQFRFDDAPEPDAPGTPFIDRAMLMEDDCIVELRSLEEAPVSVAERVVRILPQQIAAWQPPVNQRVVLVCASGMRAAQAAENLAARGIARLALVAANTL